MRKILLSIIIVFISIIGNSQIVFNRIVEDTIAHITTSVVALDTGYVYVSGTGNEYGVRSFALTYVNELGYKQWKKIYGDTQNQFWEGWYGNFKRSDTIYYLAGQVANPVEGTMGIHLSIFDDTFELVFQNTFLIDDIFKTAFYSIKTTFNDYFIIGQIWDIDDETYKLLLLKANNTGEYIWHKCYNINLSTYGSTLIETFNNNLVIGGGTEVTDVGNTRWYLLETDTAGNIIWERAFGRSNYNNGHVQGIIETTDSNYLACGSYPVARYGGGGGEYLWDGCLRKIDTDGNLIWEKLYRNYSCHPTGDNITTSGTFTSLQELPDGDIILLGSSHWYYTILRGFLMRIDKDGNIKWHRYYFAEDYTSSWQYLVNLQLAIDGGFILAGYGNEYDIFGYDPPQQAWLVKTDSLGIDGLCYTAPPELNIDIVLPATVNCSDTITVYTYIAGKSAPYTIETSIGQLIDSIYYPPTFVPVEIGLTHVNLEWDSSTYFEETITEATLSNHEWGQCIAKPVEFYTPHTSGSQQISITVTDAYGESKTITKEINVVDCGTESITENVNSGFKIYPNPAKDKIFVNIPQSQTASYLEIVNSAGQVVLTENISSTESEINIKKLVAGSYVVRVYCGNRIEGLRFEKI
ncbi:MAG: T9SS type A sorting domain-containing protein [Bacteroidales bacterium]|nr:T9SS type A sorting domain-containing protein [Bacteroidales bacterium]